MTDCCGGAYRPLMANLPRLTPVTVSVRLDAEQQQQVHQLKLQRAASGKPWPSNQALLKEAIALLLRELPEATMESSAPLETAAS